MTLGVNGALGGGGGGAGGAGGGGDFLALCLELDVSWVPVGPEGPGFESLTCTHCVTLGK